MPSDPSKPFAAAMDQARQAGEEFTKMFSAMKLPAAPNMDALLAAQKRNMEAMSAASRIAIEGAQAVARRQSEIMQQTMTEMGDSIRALSAAEAPQDKAAAQAELLKRAYERAVANTKELSDLIQQANGEALGQLNQRFTEAMDEMKALVAQAGGKV